MASSAGADARLSSDEPTELNRAQRCGRVCETGTLRSSGAAVLPVASWFASDLGVWRLGRQDPVGCSVVTACAQVTEEAYTAGLEKEKTHGLP
eukprot:2235980-Rhodomonas_salina.5